MIINQKALLKAAPIKGMLEAKERAHGVSHGLAEVGYDIRVKQNIYFSGLSVAYDPLFPKSPYVEIDCVRQNGSFTLASAIEEFEMPNDLVGVVHDKSTHIRKSLSVFNTVIEPGWKGFLTLELAYHGWEEYYIPAGAGIAQVIFHEVIQPTAYSGKYQNQADQPVEAIHE